jgi:hypothetical protein
VAAARRAAIPAAVAAIAVAAAGKEFPSQPTKHQFLPNWLGPFQRGPGRFFATQIADAMAQEQHLVAIKPGSGVIRRRTLSRALL